MMKPGDVLREIGASLWGGLKNLASEPRHLLYSLLVHAGFVAVFVLSFDWTATPRAPQPEVDVVEAVVVDEEKVKREMERLEEQEARKQKEQAERERRAREEARAAQEAREREEQRLAALKKQQQEEERRLAAERKRREEEARRARELERKKKEEAERLEALRKEREALEREKQEEAERLARLKKEEELERKRREAEEARKREEERRRQEEARRKEEEARRRALEKQLAAEEQRMAAEREARMQSEVERYVEIIKQKVARNWIKPPKWEGLQCTVRVNLIPGGEVLSVKITAGSGNSIFDTSVERAVRKASPLPLPADRSLFDRFRELKFVFDPES